MGSFTSRLSTLLLQSLFPAQSITTASPGAVQNLTVKSTLFQLYNTGATGWPGTSQTGIVPGSLSNTATNNIANRVDLLGTDDTQSGLTLNDRVFERGTDTSATEKYYLDLNATTHNTTHLGTTASSGGVQIKFPNYSGYLGKIVKNGYDSTKKHNWTGWDVVDASDSASAAVTNRGQISFPQVTSITSPNHEGKYLQGFCITAVCNSAIHTTEGDGTAPASTTQLYNFSNPTGSGNPGIPEVQGSYTPNNWDTANWGSTVKIHRPNPVYVAYGQFSAEKLLAVNNTPIFGHHSITISLT